MWRSTFQELGLRPHRRALANLGHVVSDQVVGNALKRTGILPAPERKKTTTWAELVRSHKDVLAATDFFTVEVWSMHGLVTYYVLFFIHLATRKVEIAGITPNPNQQWMMQVARNVTMTDWGFLSGMRYLLHDRDGKFCPAFRELLRTGGVKPIALPARSPNLNAIGERWVLSVESECLDRMIFFGVDSLRRAINQFLVHYDEERNHQSLESNIIEPGLDAGSATGEIQRRDRLGGVLRHYYRAA